MILRNSNAKLISLFLIGGYYLEHAAPAIQQDGSELSEDSPDKLWLVVRSLKTAEGKYDYKINKFDVIKLGRVKFRVKDFCCENLNQTAKELEE